MDDNTGPGSEGKRGLMHWAIPDDGEKLWYKNPSRPRDLPDPEPLVRRYRETLGPT
jgi:hypothetical protein